MTEEDIINKIKHLELQYDDKYTDETYLALPSSRYQAVAKWVLEQIKDSNE